MNKYQKETEKVLLNHEKDVKKKLEDTYKQALKDVDRRLNELNAQINKLIEKEPENETLIRSKIYQRDYQNVIRDQIANNMNVLKDQNVKTMQDYLNKMYEDGYLTNIYNIQKLGVNVVAPINQELLIKAVTFNTNDIPLSKRLYDNVEDAKKRIIREVSRGIASGQSYVDIARNIENSVGVSMRKANMIAQNEGARVRLSAVIDSAHEARKRGADLVKQWDATLDMKTRPVHRELDQQVAELDEPFHSSQGDVMMPKQFGIPALDINCRCALLTLPRWDVSDTYKRYDNETGNIIEAKNYADWKAKYYEQVSTTVERVKANTYEEALRLLKDIGINVNEKALSKVNREAFTSMANKINDLNLKYSNALSDYNVTITSNWRMKRALADANYVTGDLRLGSMYRESTETIKAYRRNSVLSKWTMPCSEDDLINYTITHESGHMVSYRLIKNDFDKYWQSSKSTLIANFRRSYDNYVTKINGVTRRISSLTDDDIADLVKNRSMTKYYEKRFDEIRKDVIKLAKDKDIDYIDQLSDYGKKNSFEFIAECFANANCGEPNDLGKLFDEWLLKALKETQ